VKAILVTTDFSELADAAILPAADLARRLDARLVLVHALESERPPKPHPDAHYFKVALRLYEADKELEAQALASLEERTRALQGQEWKAIVGRGAAIQAILDVVESEDVDLVVISSQGRSGLKRILLGSVAEELAREAPVPVLIWKEKGAGRG